MVAELRGAATVEAMSRPEQEETEEIFEEAQQEASSHGKFICVGTRSLWVFGSGWMGSLIG